MAEDYFYTSKLVMNEIQCRLTYLLRPSQGFRVQGKGHLFQGIMGTKAILGTGNIRKTHLQFWGNRGTSQFISGEQVPPWEGLSTGYRH